MRTRISVLLSLLVSVGLFGACGGATSGPAPSSPQSNAADDAPVNEGKLALRADIQGNTDVAGLRFSVNRVACSPGEQFEPVSETQVRDFGDLQLPGAIPAFENQPFDEDSEHLFADQYFFLPAGCYDVQSEPLNTAGDRSDECRDASEEQIEVDDGETTEIQLINQCQNEPRGGLDAVANVNNAPQLDDLEFAPSKVVQSCWATQICATARDPNNDPLEFVWEKTSGGDLLDGPNVDSTTMNQDGSVTQCINVQPGQIGDFQFNVEVYDLAFDEQENQVRIEELLAEQEEPGDTNSRDVLEFPVYSGKECPAQGRTATILMTMDNEPGIGMEDGRTLARNAVEWVNPSINPNEPILIIRDDNTQGENENDPEWIRDRLQEAGFTNVDLIEEPTDGLSLSDLDPYQIVWFSNPGQPVDDMSSVNAMLQYRDQIGGGLILQGDDIAHAQNDAFSMRPLTFLDYENNGTSACGQTIDDNVGANYQVTFGNTGNPILDGLAGTSFNYGNDIDHTSPAGEGEVTQAEAGFSSGGCSFNGPTVVTVDPVDIGP